MLFLVSACTMQVDAQDRTDTTDTSDSSRISPPTFSIIARSYGDSVLIRWAPTTPGAWALARVHGVMLERIDITASPDTGLLPWEAVTRSPLLPWALEDWKGKSQPGNTWAALAAQLLYGAASVPPEGADDIAALIARAEELSTSYGFAMFVADMDAVAAEGLALRYLDKTTRPNRIYAYRISITKADPEYIIEPALCVTESTVHPSPAAPVNVTIEETDNKITLAWPVDRVQAFTAFRVYRSSDRGVSWSLLTRAPMTGGMNSDATIVPRIVYTDSLVEYGGEYRYRICGITPFAEESAPAECSGRLRDRTPPSAPLLAEPKQLTGSAVSLSWTMIDATGDLAGFIVSRSAAIEQDYIALGDTLGSGARTFIDKEGSAEHPYYTVTAVDTAGNISRSNPMRVLLVDSLPPAAPTGLRGRIDSTGVVRLSWHLGPEPDILGYRVLMANDSTHEMTMRTQDVLQDTVFVDTVLVQTLTRPVYYQVVAVDDRYNHSAPSSRLRLERPDIVAPVRPVFIDVSVKDSNVTLVWSPSPSTDVMKQILSRGSDKNPPEAYREFAPSVMRFVDSALSPGVAYTYRLYAIDESGLVSEADEVRARPYDSGVRRGISNLMATHNAARRVMHLRWEYKPVGTEQYWFIVYRAYEGYPLEMLKAVQSGRMEYDDIDLVGEGLYRYAVKVMTTRGESPLSTPVEVRYER